MKQKRFVSMIGALVVILGAVAFITGCPQAHNNKDKAVYVSKTEQGGITTTQTVTFKADGTWIHRASAAGQSVVMMQGTYTGDPSKDGTVTATVKKELKGTDLVDVEKPQPMEITIKGGKFSVGTTVYTRQ